MSNPSDPFETDSPEITPVEPTSDQARNGWTTETLTRYVAERLQAGARRIAQASRPARNPGPTAQTDYDILGFLTMSQVGDVYELGTWVATDAERALARAELARIFAHTAAVNGVVFGRLEFIELPPGHDRVPAPPADKRGRFYYVGTASVVGTAPAKTHLADALEDRTRETCRQIVRRHHAQNNPGEATLTDAQADAAIDHIGPAAIEDMLRCRPPN